MESIQISDYSYLLPDEKIARYPLERRDDSKLLVYQNNTIVDENFSFIANYLPEKSLLVYNNTKVIQARLLFKKDTGAIIEIFCLEPILPSDYTLNFAQKGTCRWLCYTGNLKKWKEGKIRCSIGNMELDAELVENNGESQVVDFSWTPNDLSFAEVIEQAGQIPIPPYLKREAEGIDQYRYQTIFSEYKGSVAAPTAGLHFTPAVFERMEYKDITHAAVTLHVGAGTFKPVKENDVRLHQMHTEHFRVSQSTIDLLLQHINNTTAVGTTTLRTLESLYWIGYKLVNHLPNPFFISQWEVYDYKPELSVVDALNALKQHQEVVASTQIIIVPGYQFKIVNRLITNFHQPNSTLLLLVAAFIGPKWKDIYHYALAHDYRFLSYGDSSLLVKSIK
jgi:S-adenosylmethionine:tRNA ribosyltransferase-isomerase